MPWTNTSGFVARVRALAKLELPADIAAVEAHVISLGNRRLTLDAAKHLALVENSDSGVMTDSLRAADGSFVTFTIGIEMQAEPIWPAAQPRRAELMGSPFMVFLLEEDGNPRRAARWYGVLDSSIPVEMTVYAASEQSFYCLLRAILSIRDAP